jgi:hypothetical protein
MDATGGTWCRAMSRRVSTIIAAALVAYAVRTWLINRNEQRFGPAT